MIKRLGFITGWLCFAVAFMAAAAEASLSQRWVMPAQDLLAHLDAGGWITVKAKLPWLFDNLFMQTLLQAPAWFLVGLPALTLLWHCRPHREAIDSQELYDSMMTYDRLAALADEEGAANNDPSFQDFHLSDYEDSLNWKPEDTPASFEKEMETARHDLSVPFDRLR